MKNEVYLMRISVARSPDDSIHAFDFELTVMPGDQFYGDEGLWYRDGWRVVPLLGRAFYAVGRLISEGQKRDE